MTRKHYVALARALASTRPNGPAGRLGQTYRQWVATRDAIADALAAQGYLFDRARFVAATEA